MTDDRQGVTPAPEKSLLSLQLVAVLLALVFCGVTVLVFGYRPDLADGLTALPVAFSLKASFFVLILLTSIYGVRVAASGNAQAGNDSLFVLAVVVVMSGVVIEAALVPLHAIVAEFANARPLAAMGVIAVYGVAGTAVLLAILRRHALASPRKAAAWAGLAGAAAGAIGYAVYCPSESPIFVLFAYGAPCLLVAGLSALIAPRFFKR